MSTAPAPTPVTGPNATPLSVQIQQAKQDVGALCQTLMSEVEQAAGVELVSAKSHLNNFLSAIEEKLAALQAAHNPASSGNTFTAGTLSGSVEPAKSTE